MPTSLLFLETNICQRSFKRFLGKSIIFTLFRNIYFTILTNNLTRKLKKNRRIMNIIEIDLLPYLWKLRWRDRWKRIMLKTLTFYYKTMFITGIITFSNNFRIIFRYSNNVLPLNQRNKKKKENWTKMINWNKLWFINS